MTRSATAPATEMAVGGHGGERGAGDERVGSCGGSTMLSATMQSG
jgi:hypothetical protein